MFRKKKELSDKDIKKIERTLNTAKKVGTLAGYYIRSSAAEELAKEKAEEAGKDYIDHSKLNASDRVVIAYRLLRDARQNVDKDRKKDILDKAINVNEHISNRKYEKKLRAGDYDMDSDDMAMCIVAIILTLLLFFFLFYIFPDYLRH